MRTTVRLACVVLGLLLSLAAQGQKESPVGPFVPGELLVRFKTDI